jgi:hypothetical protein
VWLRSDASGVLIVQWRADAHPLLACTLRRNVELVRAPLLPGSFAFKLLCPQHGSGGEGDAGSCGHLLFMTLAVPGMAGSIQQTRSFAVHFDTEQAGRECGALLQAIQSGSLRAVKPQLVPAQHGGDQGSNNAVCGQAWGQQAEGRPSQVWVTKTGKRVQSKTKEADEMLFGYADKKSLMAAVQVRCQGMPVCRLARQLDRAATADALTFLHETITMRHAAPCLPFRPPWQTLSSTVTSSSWRRRWRRLKRCWPRKWRV